MLKLVSALILAYLLLKIAPLLLPFVGGLFLLHRGIKSLITKTYLTTAYHGSGKIRFKGRKAQWLGFSLVLSAIPLFIPYIIYLTMTKDTSKIISMSTYPMVVSISGFVLNTVLIVIFNPK